MTQTEQPLILLTNDDGIESPGIKAAAEVLAPLGEVVVVAPREQASATGRSHPLTSDGTIARSELKINGQTFCAYAVGGTPAQCVVRALVQILRRKPQLVVSGINYGENFGTGITISGTVGAALEAASYGIPSLASSLQLVNIEDFNRFNPEIDFSTAAFFTQKFARLLLAHKLPEPVDALKLEVPARAASDTPWRFTRLARHNYYEPVANPDVKWNEPAALTYKIAIDPDDVPNDSDIYTVLFDRMVSVTPLTIDMTAPINLTEWEDRVRANGETSAP